MTTAYDVTTLSLVQRIDGGHSGAPRLIPVAPATIAAAKDAAYSAAMNAPDISAESAMNAKADMPSPALLEKRLGDLRRSAHGARSAIAAGRVMAPSEEASGPGMAAIAAAGAVIEKAHPHLGLSRFPAQWLSA